MYSLIRINTLKHPPTHYLILYLYISYAAQSCTISEKKKERSLAMEIVGVLSILWNEDRFSLLTVRVLTPEPIIICFGMLMCPDYCNY